MFTALFRTAYILRCLMKSLQSITCTLCPKDDKVRIVKYGTLRGGAY